MQAICFVFILLIVSLSACQQKDLPANEPSLIINLQFDSTQNRLDALGQNSSIAMGNAAQNPQFRGLSVHKIELVANAFTPVNAGPILYHGAETQIGGSNAIDFDQAIVKDNGETILEIPLKDIAAGSYEYIRVSVSYQNFDIKYNLINIPLGNSSIDLNNETGTLASFVGFNTYIQTLQLNMLTETINDDKLQGFWAFETNLPSPYNSANAIYTGQSEGTTVVNPINSSTPIPAGSCLVTGVFDQSLQITGNENESIQLNLSFSTNQSFEWEDNNNNGYFDIDASNPSNSEKVVDMGLRGLEASYQ